MPLVQRCELEIGRTARRVVLGKCLVVFLEEQTAHGGPTTVILTILAILIVI
jgi:hypothetical protein